MRYVEHAPEAVLAAAKELLHKGLVEGTAGNISARQADGTIVITPSSVDYEHMGIDDLVVIDADGTVLSAKQDRVPSSEKPLHLECYRRFDDVGSVIHSHAVHATMFAVARQEIPACIDEFAIYVGGNVRVSEYAPSGTDELALRAADAMDGRSAALIANHGLLAVGSTPAKALHVTALVERTAQIVWGAGRLGPPVPIPTDAAERFGAVYAYLRARP